MAYARKLTFYVINTHTHYSWRVALAKLLLKLVNCWELRPPAHSVVAGTVNLFKAGDTAAREVTGDHPWYHLPQDVY
jgi:hypothetical protein